MSEATRAEFAGHISAADTLVSVVEKFARTQGQHCPDAMFEVIDRVRADMRLLHEWLVSERNSAIEQGKI